MSLPSAAIESARAPGAIGAIDIGGSKIAVGVVSANGRVRSSRSWPTASACGLEEALARMARGLREAQAEVGEEIIGIGIGSTGPVDPFGGTMGVVALLPDWRGAPIVARLAAEFGVTAAMENDADAAALAEARWGLGQSAECLMYVTISTGIGVGIVRGGELYRGAAGAHPELGHMAVDAGAGVRCYCGQAGCWESLASGSALKAWYATQSGGEAEDIHAQEIVERAVGGEALALRAVERETHYLGIGLANLITSFCPDVIALGGGMMRDADTFLPRALAMAQRLASQVPTNRTRIESAELGDDVGLAGAAAVWLHRFDGRRGAFSGIERALVRAFPENWPDAVFFKDRDSRFSGGSASNTAKLGFSNASDLFGNTDFDLSADHHARRAFEDEQRTGTPILDKLEKGIWPDGRVTWTLTSKLPLRDERGAVSGTFGITTDVTRTKEMKFALEKARKDLMDASRLAGMAEVATGLLHNVGNVLNSVNVSVTMLTDGLRHLNIEGLAKVCGLLREHESDLGAFFARDPRGARVLGFLQSLVENYQMERDRIVAAAVSLQKNVGHIKENVAMQQAYATIVGVVEPLEPATLMEDALRMSLGALARHDTTVVREYQSVPPVLAERGKVLQILGNLIRNAKYDSDERGHADKVITLRIEPSSPGAADRVRLVVQDNGIGIPPENLARVLNHGFATRKAGHGFRLHSSALVASEMKGALTVHSDGPNSGAAFFLELPVAIAGSVFADPP